MKYFIFLLFILVSGFLSAQLLPGAPNSPNKLCYNYDKAGNRTDQIPSWVMNTYSPEIHCTPNDPDLRVSYFNRKYMYPVLSLSDLENIVDVTWGYSYTGSISNIEITHPDYDHNNNNILTYVPSRSDDSAMVYLRLAPNPTEGEVTIYQKGFVPENTMIIILDAAGVKVFEREFIMGRFNCVHLPAGHYTVLLTDGRRQDTETLIKY